MIQKLLDRIVRIANSPKELVYFALVLLTAASIPYAVFEGKPILDSIWWALVTGATGGFGAGYPTTPEGRVTGLLLVMTTVYFFLPMLTASFASRLIVRRDAFTHEEQEAIKDGVEKILRRLEVQ